MACRRRERREERLEHRRNVDARFGGYQLERFGDRFESRLVTVIARPSQQTVRFARHLGDERRDGEVLAVARRELFANGNVRGQRRKHDNDRPPIGTPSHTTSFLQIRRSEEGVETAFDGGDGIAGV
jgi:hypothetical protein